MSHSHLPLAEHIGIKLKYLEPWAEFPGHCRMPWLIEIGRESCRERV